jgi:hypothetical protein
MKTLRLAIGNTMKNKNRKTENKHEAQSISDSENRAEIILYQTEDGKTRIEVRLQDETVWLTQLQMAMLFQTTKQNISLHINNLYNEYKLEKDSTVKECLTVQKEGNRQVSRNIEYYNLDLIISVGSRVKSNRDTQFRKWATERLRE